MVGVDFSLRACSYRDVYSHFTSVTTGSPVAEGLATDRTARLSPGTAGRLAEAGVTTLLVHPVTADHGEYLRHADEMLELPP